MSSFEKGHVMFYRLFPIALALLLPLCASSAVTKIPAEQFFPFRITAMRNAETPAPVVDFSYLHEKPAGASGFVTVRNGHFHLADKQFRVWGTNFAFNGCFPDKKAATQIAAHLSRLGINVVRLHSMDCCKGTRPSLIDNTCSDTMHLDKTNLDKMDFFVAELKKEGIYVNINLLVNREPRLEDGLCTTVPNLSKNVSLFNRRLIELQKQYAKALLTHTNPYTGKAYTDEPAVAFVEISNENSFFYALAGGALERMPGCFGEEFTALWKTWQRRNRNTPVGEEVELISYKKDMPITQLVMDYMQFLYETEYSYYKEMRDYLKKDLGVKSLLTGTMAFSFAGAKMQAELFDFVDIHGYWHHPGNIKDKNGKEYYGFENTPMIWDEEWGPLGWMSFYRAIGKPFTVSEYNTTVGHWYECENIPMGAAFASSLDWDGVYSFDWNHSANPDERTLFGGFDLGSNPVRVAQTATGATLYLRADYPTDKMAYLPCAHINTTQTLEMTVNYPWWNSRGAAATFLTDYATSTSRMGGFTTTTLASTIEQPKADKQSNLPILDAIEGRRLIETSRTLGIVGPLEESGTTVSNGNGIQMIVSGKTFAAVTVSAMTRNANDLKTADKWLLVAGGRTMNTDMEWREKGRGLKSQGHEPVITQDINAEIELNGISYATRIIPIDETGVPLRDKELPKKKTTNGIKFNTGTNYKTVWFLVEQPK